MAISRFRLTTVYRAKFEKKLSKRFIHSYFGEDNDDEEDSTNGNCKRTGKIKANGGRIDANHWLKKRYDGSNKGTPWFWATELKKSKYFGGGKSLKDSKGDGFFARAWIKAKEMIGITAFATFGMGLWKMGRELVTHAGKKSIDYFFEKRLLQLRSKKKGGKTPSLIVESVTTDEIVYVVPMPGILLDECEHKWDTEGFLLTISGDNEKYEYSYTTPEVPKRFRNGDVMFISLVNGLLVVLVKKKIPNTKDQMDQKESLNPKELD